MVEKALIVSAVLFCSGLFTIITRKNAVAILMGVELILNSANINFIAFSKPASNMLGGQIFAIFVIVLAAAEAAVALAIFIRFYAIAGTADVDSADRLKG
jgi:NADH-quinone oxidoreductase subunit K